MAPITNLQALICGGGPSGLAAAIMLHQQGWEDIILVERRKSHNAFERGKAFNYQLDGRGQNMLAHIGIDEQKVKEYGIANTKFTLNSFGPDGSEKSFTIPFILPGKKTAYWITRSALLDMLYLRLKQVNKDGRIKMMYDHQFVGLDVTDTEGVAIIAGPDGKMHRFNPDLVLGCDGVNSQLRKSLANLPSVQPKDFEPVITPSPSSDLMYKVIRLPREMSVSGKPAVVSDHKKSYVFTSTYKEFHRKLSLFSLPVARPDEPRSANIILPKSHDFWKIDSAAELTKFLKIGFPQLDIDDVFPPDEVNDFLDLTPGKFPDPQYSPKVLAQIHAENSLSYCVLLGDAAHGFPPDLGLGVNSALEDVRVLGEHMEMSGGDIASATAQYEKARLPDSRALVRMVKTIFPYQYNQVPWRLKLSLVKFFTQIGISKLSFGLVDQPGFRLTQDHRPSFSELEKRIARVDFVFYVFVAVVLAAIMFFAFKFFS